MERIRYTPKPIKSFKKAGAILTSDWHLREDTPTCFTGDFQKEQWDTVLAIKVLQEIHNCPVLHAGDLFHHWKPSPWLLSKTMSFLPNQFYTIYGQHDLPQHNWELRDKSGIYALEKAGKIKVLPGYHYGQVIYTGANRIAISNLEKVLVWHHLTYISKPFPGAEGGMAEGILRKYPQYDLIITGDNHQSFFISYKGRLLVNPGNITRQVADQVDFQPRVALWYAETNTIEWVNLPISKDVISREHIEIKEERDKRIDAFVSQLNGDWSAGMSFEENLESFRESNEVKDSIMEIVYKAIDNESN